MPITLENLVRFTDPSTTTLIFGAGASIPSGAPSVSNLLDQLQLDLKDTHEGYTLAEYSSLYETRLSRRPMIDRIASMCARVKPTGGILTLPDYDWHAIYTTNYDTLVEQSFERRGKELRKFCSNFDFGLPTSPSATRYYKIHGTVDQDIALGHNSRMVLTMEDYDQVEKYRQALYDQLKTDLNSSDVVIIGQSLADEDLKSLIKRAIKIKQEAQSNRAIYLLLFSKDENRSILFENQGIRVCFGGIDEFFFELAKQSPQNRVVAKNNGSLMDPYPEVVSCTLDVSHSAAKTSFNFSAMYSGRPPSYSDINAGYTFERTATQQIVSKLKEGFQFVTILGASGVGKTTLARQVAFSMSSEGYHAWEHNTDQPLLTARWLSIAEELSLRNETGLLVIDDAYLHLNEVNGLADALSASKNKSLKLIISAARNHWKPRIKSANLTRKEDGLVFSVTRLDIHEIRRLLNLVRDKHDISKLVHDRFRGFTQQEKERRLTDRCDRDFFVCLKNIFENESFDAIILREYAAIHGDVRDIYKTICALESFGVVVHRQLVIRLLNVAPQGLATALQHLDGLVEEVSIDERQGIYGWRGRHQVISNIIAKNKFSDQAAIIDLLRDVVSSLAPTYDVEMRSLRQLCSPQTGIPSVLGIEDQNELFRMMISTAPSERVPRHRLIRNLINEGQFSDAETEIRVFQHDLGLDNPVRRHKVRLILERAISTDGILPEDKASLLQTALKSAEVLVKKSPTDTHCLGLLGDVCLEIFRVTGDYDVADIALDKMKAAEKVSADPDVTNLIRRFESRLAPAQNASLEFEFSMEDEAGLADIDSR